MLIHLHVSRVAIFQSLLFNSQRRYILVKADIHFKNISNLEEHQTKFKIEWHKKDGQIIVLMFTDRVNEPNII